MLQASQMQLLVVLRVSDCDCKIPGSMLKPVYALVGEDSFLQMERLAQILKNAPADSTRIDVDGERCELSDVFDELRSFAMFGGAKIVVMRNGDDFISKFREQLEDYLEHPSNSATL